MSKMRLCCALNNGFQNSQLSHLKPFYYGILPDKMYFVGGIKLRILILGDCSRLLHLDGLGIITIRVLIRRQETREKEELLAYWF